MTNGNEQADRFLSGMRHDGGAVTLEGSPTDQLAKLLEESGVIKAVSYGPGTTTWKLVRSGQAS